MDPRPPIVEDLVVSKSGTAGNVLETMKGPPSGYFIVVPQGHDEDKLDLAALLSIVAGGWKILFAAVFFGALVAAVTSLQMRKTYRAQALVAPVTQSGANGGALRGQLGGLAALAGINVGTGADRKAESFATLVSPSFSRDFIVAQNLLPILFANRWDAAAKHWKPGEDAPTVEAGVRKFMSSVRSVAEDPKTGLVTLSVEWSSPEIAAQWANGMIDSVNNRLRIQATRDADRSIEYLNKELAKTTVVEVRQAIYGLIRDQVNNAMLANVQREYAFRFIDHAVPPDMRFSPRRVAMTIMGAGAGLFVGLFAIFIRHMRRES